MNDFDCIVVGSGAAGTMAAQTLVEAGARVLMLDVGRSDTRFAGTIPQKTFVEIRRSEEDQYRYFLGESFDCAGYATIGTGAQLTPPRRFIVDCVDELLARRTGAFSPLESLALGGLAAGWGLMCAVYSPEELERASLPAAAMRGAYQTIGDRIGISGSDADDAAPYTVRQLGGIQPPLPIDPTAAYLEGRYRRRRARVNARGYVLGRPAMALLTQPKADRSPSALRDMDFYCDDGAAWRPAWTIAQLQRHANFAYAGNVFVTHFAEGEDVVTVAALDVRDRSRVQYAARRVVLAAGVLGSARIVLRSLQSALRLPLLCNDYTYVPCVVAPRLGRSMPERTHSLTQLVLFNERAAGDVAVGTIFSYRSLLLFRLLREMPLGVRDARSLMQYLLSGFIVAGFDHPQERSDGKHLWIEPDAASPTADRLAIDYALTQAERQDHHQRETEFAGILASIGAWPIRRVHPPLGSSIHYAGTLPFAGDERPLTLAPNGRLHGTRSVFVADASGFTFLPAKPVTLSLMANAHRVAGHALH